MPLGEKEGATRGRGMKSEACLLEGGNPLSFLDEEIGLVCL